jgi:hypothetical protein
MNRKTKKELVILIAILVLFAISLYSQFSKNTNVTFRSSSGRTVVPADASSGEQLSTELLTSETPEFTGVKRNIFQFGLERGAGPVDEDPATVMAPKPPAPLIPETPDVRYLGFYYEKDTGLKMASLSNGGKIYVGRVGQVVGGRYEVVEIASDYVILRLKAQGDKLVRVPFGRAPAIYVEN